MLQVENVKNIQHIYKNINEFVKIHDYLYDN